MSEKFERHANGKWTFPTGENGAIEKWEYVTIAVLIDIRDELQKLNRLLNCPNFTRLPHDIQIIRREVSGIRRDLRSRRKKSP